MPLKLNSIGDDVKELQKMLNKIGYHLESDGKFGKNTETSVMDFQTKNSLTVDGVVGDKTWNELINYSNNEKKEKEQPVSENNYLITKEQLRKIVVHASSSKIDTYFIPLNNTMKKYDINTKLRIAHFIAQLAHESGSFIYNEEIASGEAYEGRKDLGNTYPGDGKKFKGRGLIQLTGKSNYVSYGKYLGINLTEGDNPKKIAQPDLATDVSGWYWKTRNINKYADKDDITSVTRAINPGLKGIDDRKFYLDKAKKVLL